MSRAARLSVAILVTGLIFGGNALAQTAKKELTPQQQRMGQCAKANKGKKGDAYKQGVRDCLKGKATAPAAASQQTKMKDCNAKAKAQNLKGDARRTFMSSCLKG